MFSVSGGEVWSGLLCVGRVRLWRARELGIRKGLRVLCDTGMAREGLCMCVCDLYVQLY